MNEPRPPTDKEQLRFLQSLQRLLDEGSFSASYKYALLHAIADLCIREGDDSGGELELSTSQIAEQFVQLYWPQVAPFVTSDDKKVLKQNRGRQAAVVREVREHYDRYQGSLASLRGGADWSGVRREVERIVKRMPLWKLQTVGSSERLEFLYKKAKVAGSITLEPGVAYCFRAFYPLITDTIEGAWSHFVQRANRQLLGQVVDLRSFLFGSQRSSLSKYRRLLRSLQQGRCFYCERDIKSRWQVDHFIPWAQYPLDLGHNFVLAHQGCNSRKSDLLAAEEHLQKWTERNCQEELKGDFDDRNIRHDWAATRRIARWAYGQVHGRQGQVWVEARELRPLSNDWRRILSAA